MCRKYILADFFKHAFDGGGADNFFDAGSCIGKNAVSTSHSAITAIMHNAALLMYLAARVLYLEGRPTAVLYVF